MKKRDIDKIKVWARKNQDKNGNINPQKLLNFCKDKLLEGLKPDDYVVLTSLKEAEQLFLIEDPEISKKDLELYSRNAWEEGGIHYRRDVLNYGWANGRELTFSVFKKNAKLTF